MNTPAVSNADLQPLCRVDDLVPYSGVAVLFMEQQIALFYLPDQPNKIFALSNYDPLGKANVLSRGILGDKGGELVVASPLYKQHFSLLTGDCVEDPSVVIPVFQVTLEDDSVMILV
jgi:nitrite reductase (NADH) small subunit